jgi:hypothetical protein
LRTPDDGTISFESGSDNRKVVGSEKGYLILNVSALNREKDHVLGCGIE